MPDQPPNNSSVERAAISAELAARLIEEQFPQWSNLPIRIADPNGWDNITFRLGDDLCVRLPSHDRYVPQVEKEHRWLPVLAAQLPLPIPEPIATGHPSPLFPRPWSIYSWLSAEPGTPERISDAVAFAADVRSFLIALHKADPSGGPTPGEHNFGRGGPLSAWDGQVREWIRHLNPELAHAAINLWERAIAEAWSGHPVWVHGDVVGSNLLVINGRLAAVIDFGCCAVGDPACDLIIAWTTFSGESREVFRASIPVDDPTWRRGSGWALWKALATIHQAGIDRVAGLNAARRMGWRWSPLQVIREVIADDG